MNTLRNLSSYWDLYNWGILFFFLYIIQCMLCIIQHDVMSVLLIVAVEACAADFMILMRDSFNFITVIIMTLNGHLRCLRYF